MIDGMECLRKIWIEDSGTITIYKFTAGYADREKYRHVRKFNITADKLKKAYCNLNK
ncbi:hypothetical protein [Clostridium sp. ZS2-4]|uniref:hypothetical protein n=1 Tax=Clostridium sp. ZS2-4 TaxID=2987703 RepID=UPI00227BDE6A|nr:hypothetical protein [Clostridium sp. ZS2-4]MCY6354367.1 hypothetical protein [Clostridium sp. ZS2-4]